MRSYYLFSAVLGLLGLALIITTFGIIGSPLDQKAKQFDAQRLNDFSAIASTMDTYLYDKKELPKKLSDLKDNGTTSSQLSFTDPETKKEYAYTVVNTHSYQLCTDFSSDMVSDEVKNYSSGTYVDTYYLNRYAKDKNFKHKKGYDCLTFEHPEPENTMQYNTNSYTYPQISSTISKSSTPSAKLLSVKKTGDCEWVATLQLEGFSPNTTFYAKSEGTITEGCDTANTHPYSWMAGPGGQADANGNTVFDYTQRDYGNYTYTFTDTQGKSAAVSFKYSLTTTPTPSAN